jgi:hypothetical protein
MEPSVGRYSRQSVQQQATARVKTPYLNLIHDALGARPDDCLSLEDIVESVRANHPEVYNRYGVKKLRDSLQTSLDRQAKKLESKRTVWKYVGGTYKLHNPVVAVVEDGESLDTYAERHVRIQSMSVPSPTGGRTFDGILKPYENRATSELRQTREQHRADSQDSSPAPAPHVGAESRRASHASRPSHPHPEADAQTENEDPVSDGIVLSAATGVGHSPKHNDTLALNERTTRSISTTLNDELTNTVESRAPANSYDDPGQNGKDEPDYAEIVRELRQLKRERKLQAQKIEAGHNSLPDVNTLTQSASDAQRAADEAQRAADEAQRIADEKKLDAETADKAVEDAQAKQSQLAADKLYLEKLIRDSTSLRAQLDID